MLNVSNGVKSQIHFMLVKLDSVQTGNSSKHVQWTKPGNF